MSTIWDNFKSSTRSARKNTINLVSCPSALPAAHTDILGPPGLSTALIYIVISSEQRKYVSDKLMMIDFVNPHFVVLPLLTSQRGIHH